MNGKDVQKIEPTFGPNKSAREDVATSDQEFYRYDPVAHEKNLTDVWRLIHVVILGSVAYAMIGHLWHRHNRDLMLVGLMLIALGLAASWKAAEERTQAQFGTFAYVAILFIVGCICVM